MATITRTELSKAFNVWVKAQSEDTRYSWMVLSFNKLTGTSGFRALVYDLSDEAAARVRVMCGPHGYAYCKALLIQKDPP